MALTRAESMITLPNSVPMLPKAHPIAPGYLGRSRSLASFRSIDLYSHFPEVYRPYGSWKLRRDWDVLSTNFWDRHYALSPSYWPYYYHYTPHSSYRLWLNPAYEKFWHYKSLQYYPRYAYHYGRSFLDTPYQRRYNDPMNDRPWWRPYRPYGTTTRTSDMAGAMENYKKGIISYDTLERGWLAPFSSERKLWDYKYSL